MRIKEVFLYLILIMIQSNLSAQDKGTIIYVGDPMCSWCYGISNELIQLESELSSTYNFELVVGGLRPGGGDEWNTDFRSFLKHHWEDVAKASGQRFNYDILDLEEFNYDTEPACRSVVVIRDIAPDKAFDWFASVQKGFYYENEDPKNVEFYKSICEVHNINFQEFKTRFQSEEYVQKTKNDFAIAAQLGVRSFPTILLKRNDSLSIVANGFARKSQMVERISQIK